MTRSAARSPTRKLRTEGAGTPSSGGGRDSDCQIIRHYWTEGVAAPSSSGGIAVDEYVTFGRKAQLHPPAAVVAAPVVSKYPTSSGWRTVSRRLP